MKKKQKTFLNITLLMSVMVCSVLAVTNITAQEDSSDKHSVVKKDGKLVKKSLHLYSKIKAYADSGDKVKYDYAMIYEFNDSLKEEFNGIVYQENGLKVDSNKYQLVYNSSNYFFAINHVAELAIYSDLDDVRTKMKNTKKKGVLRGIDTADIKARSLNAMDLSSDVLSYLIESDRSFETKNKIVIDVTFNEDSPLLDFYLSFDKDKLLTDSLIVHMVEIVDANPDESGEEQTEMSVYYNDLMAYERFVTFKADNFVRGERKDLKILNEKYIAQVGQSARLKRNKNYHLTILN